jgi:hypothetical protein
MRINLNWKFLESFNGLNEYLKHVEAFNIPSTIKKSNKNKCTLCNRNDHYMSVKYLKCECDQKGCSMRFLIKACTLNNSNNKCSLHVLDQHELPTNEASDENGDEVKRRGISCFIKEIIEKGMYIKNIKKPKKIEIYLKAHKQLELKQHLIQHLSKI